MIRPFYRWKSLWFGVLVIAFLGFAWARSMRHAEGLRWDTGRFVHLVVNSNKHMALGRYTKRNFSPPPSIRAHPIVPSRYYNRRGDSIEPWFPQPLTWVNHTDLLQLSLSHWFLILLFLVPWSGWLAWRWRRVMRLLANGSGRRPARIVE